MQHKPHWHREKYDGGQTFPGPFQVIFLYRSLHGEDGDHEIIAEPRVAEEGAILRIASPQAAEERGHAHQYHERGDGQVDRPHFAQLEAASPVAVRSEIGIYPLR